MNQISLKCLDVSLCFAPCEFNCGVTLTHANDWIISFDSSTNPSQSQFNQFEDAEPLFRPILQFMLDLELTSLNVRLSAPKFAQMQGTLHCPEASAHNRWLQIKPRSQIPEIALVFSPSHCGLSGESYSLGFCMF